MMSSHMADSYDVVFIFQRFWILYAYFHLNLLIILAESNHSFLHLLVIFHMPKYPLNLTLENLTSGSTTAILANVLLFSFVLGSSARHISS